MNNERGISKSRILSTPNELREQIKNRTSEHVDWLRTNSKLRIPGNSEILESNYDFVFKNEYRYLHFHPGIMQQAQDMLMGNVDRQYDDISSEIAVHDYIGHIASSQALCWNVVLPMKKHDNFKPLFEVLSSALAKDNLASKFNFGIETTEVLELNVA